MLDDCDWQDYPSITNPQKLGSDGMGTVYKAQDPKRVLVIVLIAALLILLLHTALKDESIVTCRGKQIF